MKRGLFYFILFDLIVVAFIVFNFSSNVSQEKKQNTNANIINQNNNEKVIHKDANQEKEQKIQQIINPDNDNKIATAISNSSVSHAPVCVNYGPLDMGQKVSLDLILKKFAPEFNNSNSIIQNKSPLLEIYWNLGKDKITAIELFEKQKNDGALKDERFKLVQNTNSEWIVPVSVIANDVKMAQTMVAQLSASSSHIGGKWEYHSKGDGYFYQFKDITSLPPLAINTINSSIDVLKTPCM